MGRFELVERLGVGGFGSVWKARDKELDRTVAIKIPRAYGMTLEEQENFFREARAAAQLRHPNIVSVHEVGRDGANVYIVSDYVRGVNLSDWLTGQKLTNREAAELCVEIAEALHHAHENGVVHRDLKPANIMIDADGHPHLMDFGLARREAGEVTVTMDGQVLGTPAYMSPEQARGESHTADRRSDIYSLGVILFQLLTGELPFRGNVRMIMHQVMHDDPPSPRKLNANIPKDLETITLKCLDKIKASRYPTASALAGELVRFLKGEPIQARPVSRIQRLTRWAVRRPTAALLLATLLSIAVIGPLIAIQQSRLRRLADSAAKQKENALTELTEQKHELELQVAHNLIERADAEYRSGRLFEGVALLASALEHTPVDHPLQASQRRLIGGWSQHIGRLLLHDDLVERAAFSPDGRFLVTGSMNRAQIWDVASETLIASLSTPANGHVAFSPDGQTVITSPAYGKEARLWNARMVGPLGDPLRYDGLFCAKIGFSPDSLRVNAHILPHGFRTWDAQTGARLPDAWRKDEKDVAIAISCKGNVVLIRRADETCILWDVGEEKQIGEPLKLRSSVAFFDPTDRVVVSSPFTVWDTATGKPIGEPQDVDFETIAFSEDGTRALTVRPFDNLVCLWDLQSASPAARPFIHLSRISGIGFSPAGDIAYSADLSGMLKIWHARDGREAAIVQQSGPVYAIAISPSGNKLATCTATGRVQIWDTNNFEMRDGNVASPQGPDVTLSPDCRTVLSCGSKIWIWEAGTERVTGIQSEQGYVTAVAFSPDGQMLIRGHANGIVDLWDFRTSKQVGRALKHDAEIRRIKMSPDGQTLAVSCLDGTLWVWDLAIERPKFPPTKHGGLVWAIAFSPNSQLILVGHHENSARLLRASNGEPVLQPFGHNGPVRAVAISSDGHFAATGSDDRTVKLWDLQTGRLLREPLRHPLAIYAVTFSYDGAMVASGGSDQSAHLWDVQTGKPLRPAMKLNYDLGTIAFTPDGKSIVTVTKDGRSQKWPVTPPLSLESSLVSRWARVLCGSEIDSQGALRQMSQDGWLNDKLNFRDLQ
jgi:WD40 repeat protein/serine/threonine protein kinase